MKNPKMWHSLGTLGLVALMALTSVSAQGGPLLGTFATDGNGSNEVIGLSTYTFSPGSNDLRVTTSTLTYNSGSLAVGTIGTIGSISFALPIPSLITFSGTPLNFTLTGVGPGDGMDPHNCSNATSVGQSCSLLLPGNIVDPLVLTWTPGGTALDLHLFGTVTDGTQTSVWEGDLTASLTGPLTFSLTSHPQDLYNYFAAHPSGTLTTSFQGSFFVESLAAIPEPTTLGSAAIGLTLLGAALRGRRRTG